MIEYANDIYSVNERMQYNAQMDSAKRNAAFTALTNKIVQKGLSAIGSSVGGPVGKAIGDIGGAAVGKAVEKIGRKL